jgi:hypothetical protein
MQHAARLPRRPSTRSLVAPLIALIVGAGAATGAYALIDDNGSTATSTKYVVVDRSASSGPNEAATAAAISTSVSSGPNEATTAAAISPSDSGVQLRGSKASASGSTSSSSSNSSSTATRFSGHR